MYFTFLSMASTRMAYKESLVIEELDGVHGNSVDFETTSFALVAEHCLVLHDGGKDPPQILAILFFFVTWYGTVSAWWRCGHISTENFAKAMDT